MTVPADLPEGEIGTRSLFESCIGRVFSIVGFQGHWLELEVGEILGKKSCTDSIWIEPEYLGIAATPIAERSRDDSAPVEERPFKGLEKRAGTNGL